MSFDAVVIPGGGLAEDGTPAPWVIPRLDAALAVDGSPWLLALSAGTTHRPPHLDSRRFPIFESVASARYLISKGCEPGRIILDTWSLDTIGNAYFARTAHCDPRSFRKLLIITSAFHMPRTRVIFDWIFGLTPNPTLSELQYQSVEDVGMDEELLSSRVNKEKESIEQLQPRLAAIRSLEDVHRFLFSQHGAYRAMGLDATAAPVESPWAKSY